MRLRDVDTPWNTYIHTGPAADSDRQPRAGVDRGRTASRTEPESRERRYARAYRRTSAMWLFYVVKDEQGNHAFAVTQDQHNANVQRAARRRACSIEPLGRV